MTGKTHMAVGIGTATLLLNTNNIKIITGGTILALFGSILVDIDCNKSKGSQLVKELLVGVIIITLLGLFLQLKLNINVLAYITVNKTINQMAPALLLLTAMLILGKLSSHRGFTHSLLGIVAYTVPVYMLVGSLYSWFLIGYVAHILADMLTKEKVRILYPLDNHGEYGICFKLCKTNGLVDKLLFFVFLFISAINYIGAIQANLHNVIK